jgi:hypothetical protein
MTKVQEYLELYAQLYQLEDKNPYSEVGERLRNKMDELWFSMTLEEQDEVRIALDRTITLE